MRYKRFPRPLSLHACVFNLRTHQAILSFSDSADNLSNTGNGLAVVARCIDQRVYEELAICAELEVFCCEARHKNLPR